MYIVALISISSYAPEKIREIILAGATVLRFNFSHGTPSEMTERIRVARSVIDELGLRGQIKILADLPGDKMRLGKFEPNHFHVKDGQRVVFRSGGASSDPADFIPVNYKNICDYLEVGQVLVLGDGECSLIVKEIHGPDSFTAEVFGNGFIPAERGIGIGPGVDGLDHITDKTLEHMANLPTIMPDWIAFSFVGNADYLRRAKLLLRQYALDDMPVLVAKIETPDGVTNIDEIAQECDVLMVARGDLEITAPYELLGVYQKQIIEAARRNNKQSIVGTQILESLLERKIPTRSEILDLTNIVLDGADGIMLSQETGLSCTPGYSVAVAKKIINAVEQFQLKNETKI